MRKGIFSHRLERVFILIFTSLLLVSGCATKDVRVQSYGEVPPFHRVAVMPFDVTFCQSCTDSFIACKPANGQIICEQVLNDIGYRLALSFAREIAIYGKYDVVEPQEAARALPFVNRVSMAEIGRRLRVEMMVFGTVKRFQDRIGGPMSAQRPASVYFEVSLVDARSGKTVWRAVFDQTQKSLSADITNLKNFMRGGGKWLTAAEFAEVGIAQIVELFPGLEGMKVR